MGADTGPGHTIQVQRPLSPEDGITGSVYTNEHSMPASGLWDGEWHVIRFHFRNSTTPSSWDGKLMLWIDGTLFHDEPPFNTEQPGGAAERITGFSFTHNKDDGPSNENMYMWWGPIKYYLEDPGW